MSKVTSIWGVPLGAGGISVLETTYGFVVSWQIVFHPEEHALQPRVGCPQPLKKFLTSV